MLDEALANISPSAHRNASFSVISVAGQFRLLSARRRRSAFLLLLLLARWSLQWEHYT